MYEYKYMKYSIKLDTANKKVLILLASGGGTVEEHLPHQPKVGGLSPATVVGTRRKKAAKRFGLIRI